MTQINLNCYSVLIRLRVFPDYKNNIKEQWEKNALADLVNHGLISIHMNEITEKGRCLVEHVGNLELPVQSWKMP